MYEKIGFVDSNGIDIRNGDICETYDSKGKKWIGKIIPEEKRKILKHPFLKTGQTLYVFMSNYGTWINDQEYASELTIISR